MTTTTAAGEFVLPNLGESVDQATITRWLKDIGEHVAEGEPIVEVATDKVDSEVIAPFTGIVSAIHVAENEAAQPGQALATITPEGTAAPTPLPAASAPSAAAETAPTVVAPTPTPATPAVPQPITTEPGQVSLAGTAPHSANRRVEKLSPIRRVIADRMMHSLQSTAQLTSVIEIDVTHVAERRAALEAAGRPTSFLSFFARAALDAVRTHPVINSTIDPTGTELTIYDTVDLGIAVDTPRGLMVPVIRGADSLDVHAIGAAITGLADRVRGGGITPAELAGGTFTITNTGSRGALFDTPILNSPQSAILGTGTITRRVVPLDDDFLIGIRSFAYFSLTYDHRVIDGADAARYLSEIKQLIETRA